MQQKVKLTICYLQQKIFHAESLGLKGTVFCIVFLSIFSQVLLYIDALLFLYVVDR